MTLQMNGHYPYGQCTDPKLNCKEVLVHQQIILTDCTIKTYEQKIQALNDKSFRESCMTQLLQAKMEANKLNIYYEYIPIQVGDWVANMSKNLLLQYRDRLLKFASLVAQKHIKTQFKFVRLGLTNDQQISYFLGLDFSINPELSPQKLKFYYWNQIRQLFDPFIYQQQVKMRSSADSENIIFSSQGLKKVNTDSINIKDHKLQSSLDLAGQQRIINQFKHHKQLNLDSESPKSGNPKKKDYELQFEKLLQPVGPATCTSQDGMKKNLKKLNFVSESNASSSNTPIDYSQQQYNKIINSSKKGNYVSEFQQLLLEQTKEQKKPKKELVQTKSSVSIEQKVRQQPGQQLKSKADNSIQNSLKLLEKLKNRIK